MASTAFNVSASFNGTKATLPLEATDNTWKTVSFEADAKEGSNVFLLSNTSGRDFFVDNVTFTPIELDILLSIDDAISERTSATKAIYNLSGMRLSSPKSGINIIRLSDGTVKKQFVK